MSLVDRIHEASGYVVSRELTAGGMARVFVATSPDGERVVLKTPHDKDPITRNRFYDEARLGFLLHHANLVETRHLFAVGDIPFLAVGFIAGDSLSDVLERAPVDPVTAARIGAQVLRGLHAIHTAVSVDGSPLQAVHRDVTPRNILVDDDGAARLIDLGICSFADRFAPATEPGALCGTIRFLAPELWGGGSFSPQSDMWSLGMCLLESLHGEKILTGTFPVVVGRILSGDYVNDVERTDDNAALLDVIAQLMAKNAADRPADAQTAAELLDALTPHAPAVDDPRPRTVLIRAQDIMQVDSDDVERFAAAEDGASGSNDDSASIRPTFLDHVAPTDGLYRATSTPDGVIQLPLHELAALREQTPDRVPTTDDVPDVHSLPTQALTSDLLASDAAPPHLSESQTAPLLLDPFSVGGAPASDVDDDPFAVKESDSFDFIPEGDANALGLLPSEQRNALDNGEGVSNDVDGWDKTDEMPAGTLPSGLVSDLGSDLGTDLGSMSSFSSIDALDDLSTSFLAGAAALPSHNADYNQVPAQWLEMGWSSALNAAVRDDGVLDDDDATPKLALPTPATDVDDGEGGDVFASSASPPTSPSQPASLPSTSDQLGAYLRQVRALEGDAREASDDWASTQSLAILHGLENGKVTFPWESDKGARREPTTSPRQVEMLVHSGLFSAEHDATDDEGH